VKTTGACVALDFGGTIATPGPSPTGTDVVEVLRAQFDCCAPPGFAVVVDRARRDAAAAYRASGRRTLWETILTRCAEQTGARLPDARRLVDVIWRSVPDAVVDPLAAATVRQLGRSGVILVLACNTQRTLATRQRTLSEAGIADCFTALVLSSVLGVGKPDPRFYAAVTTAAREASGCGPAGVVFVGDTVDRDVLGPRRCGMRPVLIQPGPPPAGLSADVPVVAHLSELPALLERWP
jgi:putative hydrolase of the HAD superfamily